MKSHANEPQPNETSTSFLYNLFSGAARLVVPAPVHLIASYFDSANPPQAEVQPIPAVGPGDVDLTGDCAIGLINAKTNLTVTDGALLALLLGDRVTIKTVQNNPHKKCDITVRSITGKTKLDAMGNVTVTTNFSSPANIIASGNVKTQNIGYGSEVNAKAVVAEDIATFVIINANEDIKAKVIDSFCKLTSAIGEICVGAVRTNCELTAADELVVVCHVGDNNRLISQRNSIKVKDCEDNVNLQAQLDISTRDLGNNCNLRSTAGSVHVRGVSGDCTNVTGNNDVIMECGSGAGTSITAVNGNAQLQGKFGTSCAITAKENVRIVGAVDQGASVLSISGEIRITPICGCLLTGIGANSYLTAVSKIFIEGCVGNSVDFVCPDGEVEIWGLVAETATFTAKSVLINGMPRVISANRTLASCDEVAADHTNATSAVANESIQSHSSFLQKLFDTELPEPVLETIAQSASSLSR